MWQSPDPILVSYLKGKPNGGVGNSFNLNLFAYTYQNPIKYVDPNGTQARRRVRRRVRPRPLRRPFRNRAEENHYNKVRERYNPRGNKRYARYLNSYYNRRSPRKRNMRPEMYPSPKTRREFVPRRYKPLTPSQMRSMMRRYHIQEALKSRNLNYFISSSGVPENQPKSTIYHRKGGIRDANRAFNILTRGRKITTQPNGARTARFPNGTTISVRSFSRDGSPTIQINIPNVRRAIKVRYNK